MFKIGCPVRGLYWSFILIDFAKVHIYFLILLCQRLLSSPYSFVMTHILLPYIAIDVLHLSDNWDELKEYTFIYQYLVLWFSLSTPYISFYCLWFSVQPLRLPFLFYRTQFRKMAGRECISDVRRVHLCSIPVLALLPWNQPSS